MRIEINVLVLAEMLDSYELLKQLATPKTRIILESKLEQLRELLFAEGDVVPRIALIDEINSIIANDLALEHKPPKEI